MTLTLALTLLFACAAHAATVWTSQPRPKWMTPTEWAVAMCETGLNWRHHTSDYQGAYGFYRGSWDQFKPVGYPNDADQATPWQQTVVARRIRARYGWTGWGCYTGGGYRYWMGRVPRSFA